MAQLLTRAAFLKWNEYLELARQAVELEINLIPVDPAVLLRIARHIESLNEAVLQNITVVGCVGHHEPKPDTNKEVCVSCGLVIEEEDGTINDYHGIHHAGCAEVPQFSDPPPVPVKRCDHCGLPLKGSEAKTGYGTFHIHCHGPAQRSRFKKQTADRLCVGCSRSILECMGFVKIGDYLEGRETARELCGYCSEHYRWDDQGNLIPVVYYDPCQTCNPFGAGVCEGHIA